MASSRHDLSFFETIYLPVWAHNAWSEQEAEA